MAFANPTNVPWCNTVAQAQAIERANAAQANIDRGKEFETRVVDGGELEHFIATREMSEDIKMAALHGTMSGREIELHGTNGMVVGSQTVTASEAGKQSQ